MFCTISYRARSIFCLRAASSRAAESDCGVTGTAGSVAPGRGLTVMPPPVSGRPGDAPAGVATGRSVFGVTAFDASMLPASSPANSATRRVSAENSICLRNATSRAWSGSCTARSASGTSSFTLSSSVTSFLEMRAFSAFSISAWRRFSCLISPARASSVSRSPYSPISCAAVFTPMPGTPGTLSVESPISDCTSITLSGVTPNFSNTSGDADLLVLHRVVHDHAVVHELHQVLVGRHDGDVGLHLAGLPRIGGDQVVGLEAEHFEARNVEGARRVADQRKLRDQVFRRRRPVRLVVRIHLIAERALGLVEDHREVRRLVLRLHVAQQLPQHVAEAEHRIDLQAVGLAVQRRQRVIGAENVSGAVDQKDVVALFHRTRGGGGRGCGGFRSGFGHAANIGLCAAISRAGQALSTPLKTLRSLKNRMAPRNARLTLLARMITVSVCSTP